ncbi:di-trans,poly-cis-decaprenylcistransferase [Methanocalculus chunghsingensis]|uniref:Di-trans,poly-cis-decaprenylcistransferase n=1 Tax=Methanocalculus chunghsingensis TaxID=156457 RepID=A0A8J8B3C4_9EURY|nr:undecaprenyl diphosphate synthase family protein [Methanocalculus chunghsingensis]MBR1368020.1 di-trans,poly-cis-decaprenylcistransferase [Methanocalculus chunghsingensis]
MIHKIYEYLLLKNLTTAPSEICFMLTIDDLISAPERIYDIVSWSLEVTGIRMVTFHIDTEDPTSCEPFIEEIRKISQIAHLHLHQDEEYVEAGKGLCVMVVIGKSGRWEVTESIRRIAEEGVDPCDVTEEMIEEHLTFRCAPDLIIKTGGSHLTDFLIWQSVYSELFFLDMNWKFFRKTDFLRALRDYQSRTRRFGA